MGTKKHTKAKNDPALATNRKARRDYEILEKFETGIVLYGTEVKSIRNKQLSLDESYARIDHGELFVIGMHVMPYEHGNQFNHESRRSRKLLMHRREINKLLGQTQIKGCALIPLKVYLKKGRIKMQIGLGKGKHQQDKREDLKRRDADLEARRAMAHYCRG